MISQGLFNFSKREMDFENFENVPTDFLNKIKYEKIYIGTLKYT